MYRTNRNWAVIQLLLRLKAFENGYPDHLFVTRRSSFITKVFRIVRFVETNYMKTPLL